MIDVIVEIEDLPIAPPDRGITYLPSPQQIRQACRQIQDGWSPTEERKRRAWCVAAEIDYGRVATVHQ